MKNIALSSLITNIVFLRHTHILKFFLRAVYSDFRPVFDEIMDLITKIIKAYDDVAEAPNRFRWQIGRLFHQ